MLDAGLVDTVEVAVMPVILGAGFHCCRKGGTGGSIWRSKALPSGIQMLKYSVVPEPGAD